MTVKLAMTQAVLRVLTDSVGIVGMNDEDLAFLERAGEYGSRIDERLKRATDAFRELPQTPQPVPVTLPTAPGLPNPRVPDEDAAARDRKWQAYQASLGQGHTGSSFANAMGSQAEDEEPAYVPTEPEPDRGPEPQTVGDTISTEAPKLAHDAPDYTSLKR